MKVKKGYPLSRPNSRKKERYGDLTRYQEWTRLGVLARSIKKSIYARKKKILLDAIAKDFKRNPRAVIKISKKFNVSEYFVNLAIDKYCTFKFTPKGKQNDTLLQ